MQFLTLSSSKMEVSEIFFHIMTTRNDYASYVKHLLGRIFFWRVHCSGYACEVVLLKAIAFFSQNMTLCRPFLWLLRWGWVMVW